MKIVKSTSDSPISFLAGSAPGFGGSLSDDGDLNGANRLNGTSGRHSVFYSISSSGSNIQLAVVLRCLSGQRFRSISLT